jgi:hypothetical protein
VAKPMISHAGRVDYKPLIAQMTRGSW